jgi:hypothetical protein
MYISTRYNLRTQIVDLIKIIVQQRQKSSTNNLNYLNLVAKPARI